MTLNFGPQDLLKIYTNPHIPNVPDIDPWEAEAYATPLRLGMEKHGIDNRREAAHYLAQVGYETGCLNWLEEFGGGSAWYAPWYGRATPMLTHKTNYAQIGRMIGVPDLDDAAYKIGCVNNDPTDWPRNIRLSMEVAAAFWKSRGFDVPAAKGDAGFDEIMLKWLGAAKGHPSYRDRWALYRAMINKLPRPFVVPEGGIQATQKQNDKRAGRLPNIDGTQTTEDQEGEA